MPVQWTRAKKGTFAKLPVPKQTGPIDPEWEALMSALQAGEEVAIRYEDDDDRRRTARVLGRRAAGHGFKTEIRYDLENKQVVAIKSDQPLPPRKPRTPPVALADITE